ncbi:DUF433 domain-containing protein [Gloeobacter morelensis]|uniref:DUF433 domain-containing protein n=1 Tax=Gloeobacter morelensis MG652769 TaxID=2781736 RepID=A0ABY3PGH2_9CYAN|nr:DUF433 domain-containing protein [Gloeobacter morelensis MG652769]
MKYGTSPIGRLQANSDETFFRITLNPALMGGKPCIRSLRVTVGMGFGLMVSGYSTVDLLL